jgi:hypothetical protein
MLYGSLYKVFQQLSRQCNKKGGINQYEEIIIPKIFLKILLNEAKIPKIKRSIRYSKTSQKEELINLNNFINEEVDNNLTPTKINSYCNFNNIKKRKYTPTVKSHYINNPNPNNSSLPKIKFKKKISIITKKSEDLKNSEKNDFLISEIILKQLKKSFYQTPLQSSKESCKFRNQIKNVNIKNNDNIKNYTNKSCKSNKIKFRKKNNGNFKIGSGEKKKIFNKIMEMNNREKNKDNNKGDIKENNKENSNKDNKDDEGKNNKDNIIENINDNKIENINQDNNNNMFLKRKRKRKHKKKIE